MAQLNLSYRKKYPQSLRIGRQSKSKWVGSKNRKSCSLPSKKTSCAIDGFVSSPTNRQATKHWTRGLAFIDLLSVIIINHRRFARYQERCFVSPGPQRAYFRTRCDVFYRACESCGLSKISKVCRIYRLNPPSKVSYAGTACWGQICSIPIGGIYFC